MPGRYRSTCRLPGNLLAEGRHLVNVRLMDPSLRGKRAYGVAENAISFEIFDPMDGSGVKGTMTTSHWPGVVRPKLDWSTKALSRSIPVR